MSLRPRFKHCYRVDVVAPNGVFLLSERGHVLLRGAAYLHVAPLLDGRRTVDEIVAHLDGQLPAAQVHYAIELLRQKGYLVDGSLPAAPEGAAFWELLDVPPEVVARRLAEMTISVRTFGAADAGPFLAALAALGIRVTGDGDRWVALTDDHLQTGLDALNREALERGKPWMLVKLVGVEAWLGPVFVPGQTGCWACLAQRLAGNRKPEAFLQKHLGLAGPIVTVRAGLPSTLQTAIGLVATETARWIVQGKSEALEGRVVTFDTVSLERRTHLLTRRPQCAQCGDPAMVAEGQRRPIVLQRGTASFTAEGGYRSTRPEVIVHRLEHHVSPITGLVSHLKRLLHKSGSELTPSYVADHNFAHIDEDLFFLREGQRSRSGGKGKSDIQAKASALGESIERYAGLYQGDEARVRARLSELGGAAIHPNDCMLFSERQLAERERWNRSGSRFTRVPELFDPRREIEWSPVFPLLGGEPRYLPTALCYYGYGRGQDVAFAYGDSNGCAAGATREEAVFQGLLELIERDCTAMWWYGRARRPGVDLASFGDPYYHELEAYYRSIHRSLWALEITNDLGIPTFVALSHRTDKAVQDICFGLGAHLDPKIALLRAVTELNQFLPGVFLVTPEAPDAYGGDADAIHWWKTATVESEPYLLPDPSVPLRRLCDHAPCGAEIHDGIMRCVRALQDQGIDALALDQTRPDTGLYVVKMIAPGLRHFWARFAPGRLYDVPVRLGWRKQPLREEELNPYAIFF